MAHICQNEKVCSLHIPAIKLIGYKQLVYRFPIILLKLQFLWVYEIWGHFVKNWYFVNKCLIKVRNLKFFCTYVTHIIVIICRTPHWFPLNKFQLNIYMYYPSQFCGFFFFFFFLTVKSHSVTQRSGSQENAYKKSLNSSLPHPHKTIGSDISFTIRKRIQLCPAPWCSFK